ncbi:F-box protein [Phanerochaete sordida]|uniref:F-box protein n=1 Tax=Phanerochaete sordida TaxID=48140 RepID=A0A9P3LB43_9APHY|nr:F-box protein [Phanerochaete sordida]
MARVGPRLPPELLHYVLQDLDKPALTACAAVSHAWVELARPYLFKSVVCVVYAIPGYDDPRYTLRGTDDRPASAFPLFADFLESHTQVAASIHTLELHTGSDGWYHGFDAVVRILRCLPRLQSLTFSGRPFHHDAPAEDPRATGTLPAIAHLGTLKIESIIYMPTSDLTCILALFGSIAELVFGEFVGRFAPTQSPLVAALPAPHVAALDLSHISLPGPVLVPGVEAWRVRALRLPEVSPYRAPALAAFLARVAPTLQRLCFRAARGGPARLDTAFAGLPVLPVLPVLTHLALPLLVAPAPDGAPGLCRDVYAGVLRALSDPPPALATLVLVLEPAPSPRAIGAGLLALQRRAAPRAGGLPLRAFADVRGFEDACLRVGVRRVEVCAGAGHVLGARDKAELGRGLPRLLAKGVLQFV